jgi:hypothetical protein
MFAYPYGGYRAVPGIPRGSHVTPDMTSPLLPFGGLDSPGRICWHCDVLTLTIPTPTGKYGSKVNGDYDWRGLREGADHVLRTFKQIALARGTE